MGDFNAVTNSRERKGLGRFLRSQEVREFKNFRAEMDLVDPRILGRKFTWYREDNSAMSRLDKFLLSSEWIQTWSVVAQWALNRDVSDHCPIVLKLGEQEWDCKLFRFNNCWLAHQGLKSVVEEAWKIFSLEGWMAFILKEKLKLLKAVLINWSKNVFGNVDLKIKKLEKVIGGTRFQG